MDQQQRQVVMPDGRRRSVKLDDATWQAIELIASDAGVPWRKWVIDVMGRVDDDENLTAAVRAAAMTEMLERTFFANRADDLERMDAHPFMKHCGPLDDERLAEILKTAQVDGSCDFQAFRVLYGWDDADQPCVWIKNGMRDGLHFAFVVPGVTR